MSYKIDNAIIKKDRLGKITLIDPQRVFDNEEAFVAIKSDDLITIQLLINSILNNDFKRWREITQFSDRDTVKSLFVRLGYTKEDIAQMLNEL
ncbi:MAG: hypothetical protein Q4P18_04995 [Methanobrevibacter sp.]|uniref:hypothetical protein n=1 Tax=Methanobrevibacter sp. TaxID=66852 RepID=UPI0026DFF40C|nr:hypothetical protein [Methanobrevibacter sp.]MDO5848869.1 hypothetical protein [Methanobrevibacter sp.]